MASLYIDRRGVELRLDGQAIAFYENNERTGTIPIAPLERIFLKGDVRMHSGLLGRLGENGTGIVLLSGRKSSVNMLMARPHNDAARRVTQYFLCRDETFCREFSRCVVETKLKGQLAFLAELREKKLSARYELTYRCRQMESALESLSGQPDIPAIRGIEGNAAASYFAGLASCLPESLHFSGRNRRPPRDPLNVVLSLGYTLLHAETVIALYSSGLDPYIGFYHALDFGRESLACDLVESSRTDIDRFAVGLFSKGILRPEDFSSNAGQCMLGKAGRARFYPAYEEHTEQIRKKISENVRDICDVLKSQEKILFPQTRNRQHQQDDTLQSENRPFRYDGYCQD